MPSPDAPSFERHPPSAGGPAEDSAVDPTFDQRGYLTRARVLTAAQCALLEQHLTLGREIEPADWWKGRAVTDRLLFDIASSEPLLALLRPVLGDNLILYGASTVERRPGERHAWHVDIESSAPSKRFATVWIGLRNTSRESGLKLIGGSHRYSQILQQVQHANGYRRGDADDETVLNWARTFDPEAEIALPAVADGDAIVFDGRLWHGSLNQRVGGARLALLLQYASADSPVFKSASKSLEWPFEFDPINRPPVIVVSGGGNGGLNQQVAPPPTSPPQATTLTTEIQPIALPLAEDVKRGWQQHPFFQGLTNVHDAITCHASVLSPGRMPHPPHCHLEEEILIVLDGDAELLIGDSSDVSQAKAHPIGAGTFAYYPAYQHHTLRNVGDHPLTYLMFRWRGAPVAEAQALETTIVDLQSQHVAGRKAFRTSLLFEGPTHWLGKLHAHYSEVEPGGGYQAHCDPYDIAIVLLSGSIETLGTRVDPFGVVYYAANELHGLCGVGTDTARYLVFEFHGLRGGPGGRTHIRGNVPHAERKLYGRIARPLRQLPWLRRLLPKRIKVLAKEWLR